ncbi:hypothetical protein AMTR_s00025p00194220 [Amborella trichopoda]|uniref:Uncharacterized protein n=2 Tax=Amborella trichopoda TaxID=13333 RepID=W1PX62_AMBTC|nr:hypothetical protein AMTR_s00025p00194220 [Amborella trichopoda]
MKRKELEEVYDDFSDFSLSSPGRKIRRLDAELPPIMEEPNFPSFFEEQVPEEHFLDLKDRIEQLPTGPIDVGSPVSVNEERALVLYKPLGSPGVSFRVNPFLLPALRNKMLWLESSDGKISNETTPKSSSETPLACNNSKNLAVVPWVPSQLSVLENGRDLAIEDSMFEPMVQDVEMGTAMEEDLDDTEQQRLARTSVATEPQAAVGVMGGADALQWQQHCMTTPQQPPGSTPIMWSW